MKDNIRLKIAIVSPVWLRVPPVSYGGIEIIVSLLTEGFVKRGHDVTLFASGDSITAAKLVSVFRVCQKDKLGMLLPDIYHTGAAYTYIKEMNDFDIVHDHTSFSGVVLGSFISTPVLATMHGEFNPVTRPFYNHFSQAVYYNAISEFQRRSLPGLRWVNTVFNAIDIDKYRFSAAKDDFLLSVSRISQQKGTHLAIEVAKRTGKRLIITGKIDPGKDLKYFRKQVEPHVDGEKIIFLGEVSETRKIELLQRAECFIFPIQWAEPFGLVMIEAMASGTPVVAFRNGSTPEIVDDGKSGFVVDSLEEMVAKVKEAGNISPSACRRHAERHFHPDIMVENYLENYKLILAKEGKLELELSKGESELV